MQLRKNTQGVNSEYELQGQAVTKKTHRLGFFSGPKQEVVRLEIDHFRWNILAQS